MIDDTRLLLYQAPSRKNGKVWNSTHLVACCQLRIAFCINLQHNRSSCHVASGTLDLRSCDAARAAPVSPEIYQHRNASPRMTSSNCSGSTSRGSFAGGSGDLQAPQRPVSARCLAGIRFLRPQTLQVRTTISGLQKLVGFYSVFSLSHPTS